MGFQDFISESEAASITGVSRQTLNRFTEAGYLQIEVDGDGMRLFNKRELFDIFGLNSTTPPTLESKVEKASSPQCEGATKLTFRPDNELTPFASLSSEPVKEAVPETEAPAAAATITSTKSFYSDSPIQRPSRESFATNSVEAKSPTKTEEEKGAAAGVSTPSSTEQSSASNETARLTAVTSMLEKLLDIREAEIKDLKEQRDWLRSRVEKLEEKGDRDQLLLLSETQVIRKLIANNERRSPFRAALEWLGVIEAPEKPQTGTIEMQQAQPAATTEQQSVH